MRFAAKLIIAVTGGIEKRREFFGRPRKRFIEQSIQFGPTFWCH
jgi:hypothetical protein